MAAPRIVIVTTGSYGDVHPFVAVAQALQAAGFAPVLATMAEHGPRIEAAGVAFHSVRPSIADLSDGDSAAEARMVADFARGGTRYLIDKSIAPWLAESLADVEQVMAGAALVIASSFAVAARIAAERQGLPLVTVLLSPMLHMSAHEPIYSTEAPWLPGFFKLFGPGPTRAVLDLGRARLLRQHRAISRFRTGIGLPPLAGDALVTDPLRADLVACLYSPLLGPLPPDAVPQAEVLGFTFHDGLEPVPPALDAFLDAGDPPIIFSLGSFAAFHGKRFYDESAAAARLLGRRAVLLVAPGEEAAVADRVGAGSDMHVAGYVPHSRVFPRGLATVHHGGVGTLGQALRAGRPQLVCPFWGDQFDNAERVARMGVGARLDHRRYSAERAARALDKLLAPATIDRAARAGEQVAQENGAAALAARAIAMLG
jgi:rhamnosyltransferase subunit B